MRARRDRWRIIAILLRMAGFGPLAVAMPLNLLIGGLPLAFIFAVSAVLREPAGTSGVPLVPVALLVALAAFGLAQVLAPWQAAIGEVISRRVDGRCLGEILTVAFTETPIRTLESPELAGRLGDARAAFDGTLPSPGAAAAGAVALIARYTQLLGAIGALVVVLPWPSAAWVGAACAVAALVIRFGQRGSLGRFATVWDGLAGHRRRVLYLRGLLTGPAVAKEIRVLGLRGWLGRRHDSAVTAHLSALWARRRALLGKPFLALAAVGLAGAAVALLALGSAAAAGELTLVQWGIAVQAVLIPVRFGVYFPESDVQTQFGLGGYRAVQALRDAARPEPARGGIQPGPVRQSIRFSGVRFAYPGGSTVLDGLDLELPAGSSTAVVGLNGAGKTTIVKLLAGFCEPVDGRVLVDGVALPRLDPVAWRRRLAVVFQEFNRYELSAAENITLGMPQDAAVARAAARSGAADLLASLPNGPQTTLFSRYPGGRDLSGGQWQRIALARAFHAVHNGASVLVLDEPTAQLSPRAEVEFFDRFLETTAGLTTLVISHRFSTVRRADHIAVLDGGRVAEYGSHDDLMALGGHYAEMFTLQARRFADSGAAR